MSSNVFPLSRKSAMGLSSQWRTAAAFAFAVGAIAFASDGAAAAFHFAFGADAFPFASSGNAFPFSVGAAAVAGSFAGHDSSALSFVITWDLA